jgi:CRISPR-associated protein Cas5h
MVEDPRPRSLNAVRFRWQGRFGFFLRAEAPVVGIGYPLPPRTAVLGLIANILGFEKDALAHELADAQVALSGSLPRTHWHACNLRKIKSARFLPATVSLSKCSAFLASEESNTQSRQEWLLDPSFEVLAVLPPRWHDDFSARVRDGRFHFTPCLGLSEMIATVQSLGEETLTPLPEGAHRVVTVARAHDATRLDTGTVLRESLRVLSLTLPRTVTEDREFSHAVYHATPDGSPLPVISREAWQGAQGPVVFL